MARPKEIDYKLYRAKQHYEELERELQQWWASNPGHMVPAPESTAEYPLVIFATKEPIPARFGLIAGDYLQNLRSVLDYLIWQLVLANKGKPSRSNAFPVCTTAGAYQQALDRGRLNGVAEEAKDVIRTLQPAFMPPRTNPSAIQVLDELTNENKHRTPLLTTLVSTLKPEEPYPFRYMEFEIVRIRSGQATPGERITAFVAFDHPLVHSLEVMAILDALYIDVAIDTLPKFDQFF